MAERAHTPDHDRGATPGREPPTDLALIFVIAACLVPVGWLVIAVRGGGLAAVVIAFVALVLILVALVRLLGRAMGQPGGELP